MMLGATDNECDFGGFEVPPEVVERLTAAGERGREAAESLKTVLVNEGIVEAVKQATGDLAALGEKFWWLNHPAELRPVELFSSDDRGFFHRWMQDGSEVVAVVELCNGRVITVPYRRLRFADVLEGGGK